MSAKPVVIHPDPVLREVCRAVEAGSPDAVRLARDLRLTLSRSFGIGLAAPQIGIAQRMALVASSRDPRDVGGLILINPTIVSAGMEMVPMNEGCLSLPRVRRTVYRPDRVTVAFVTENGEEAVREFLGLDAKCVQHEMDHLDGVLIIDKHPLAAAPTAQATAPAASATATVSHFSRSR